MPALPDAAEATASPLLDERVAAAQARMVFERSRFANLMGLPVAALVLALLWPHLPAALLAGWALAKVAVCAWRAAIGRVQPPQDDRGACRRLRQLQWALAADGLVFGGIGTWLVPEHGSSLATLLLATMVCAAAVGFVVLSHHFGTLMAFVLPLLVPMVAQELWFGDELGLYAGIGGLLLLTLLVVDGWRAARDTRASLRSRLQLADVAAQREDALALAQRHGVAKARFLTTMSHEIRTPLHGMLGVTRLLMDDTQALPPAELRRQLATLEHNGERLLSLVNDVLEFSRLERGALRVLAAPFDLAALLADTLGAHQAAAQAKGLALRLEPAAPSACWVHGDAARLRQVLGHLLDNAIKFTDHGAVAVRLQREAASLAVIEVADTGPGIAPAELERIFEAFHQADNANNRRHGGAGLGLAIARELARHMGGDLHGVARPGSGACLVLRLPLPELPAWRPAANDRQDTAPGSAGAPLARLNGRVLLVEDNTVNAMVAEAMLQRAGLAVDWVSDGEQAVLHCRAQRPDVVLMDCQMPVLDGLEATRRIRTDELENRRTPATIIGLTANATAADRAQCLAAGMDDYLEKPFREQHLHALLARHLRGLGGAEAARAVSAATSATTGAVRSATDATSPPAHAALAQRSKVWQNPG